MGWISSGRAPLLADHDMTMHIGVIESAEIGKDRVGRAVVRFGKGAQADAYFQDVVDGIRTSISVGYSIDHVILEEETETHCIYRVMKWKPLEISLVSIPADQTVGVGRSEGAENGGETIIKQSLNSTENKPMTTESQPSAANAPANPSAPIVVDVEAARTDARNAEVTRIREIQALASRHNVSEKGQEFINAGKSVDAFRSFVLDNMGNAPVQTADNSTIGLSNKEARAYSFLRVMRHLADPTSKRAFDECAFEREVSEAVAGKFKGRKFQGNFQIPTEVLIATRAADMHKRDLNVATGSAGGYLVANELRSDSFIEMLRNRLLVRQLGARVLTGLEGNLAIPKQSGGATAYWLNEGGEPTESQQTVGQVGLTPKTVGAFTEFTRRMIQQSSLDVETFVRDDLAKTLATKIDLAALKGSGAGGEPLGILNTTGIGLVTITPGTFTEGKLIDLETAVAVDNADLGSLAYLACATDRGLMKQKDVGTDTGKRIWTNVAGQPGVGEVNGYLAYATNQLAANEVIFGNWEDLIIGEWGVLDLQVNPYSLDKSGGVRVTAFQDVDVAVRNAESFARTGV